jgi:hypothetical protein
VEAAAQGSAHPALESAIDDAITQLSVADPTPAVKGMLIEARRLRSIVGQWRTIHPPERARREMLSKVMDLASAALRVGGETPRSSVTGHRSSSTMAASAAQASSPDVAVQASMIPPSGTQLSGASLAAPPSAQPVSGQVMRVPASPASEPRFPMSPGGPTSPGGAVVRGALVHWEVPPDGTGITVKVLHHDPRERAETVVVRLAPGAELAAPTRGTRAEELYVLEGTILVGMAELRTGDYCRFDPALNRAPLRSSGGCVVLLIGPER